MSCAALFAAVPAPAPDPQGFPQEPAGPGGAAGRGGTVDLFAMALTQALDERLAAAGPPVEKGPVAATRGHMGAAEAEWIPAEPGSESQGDTNAATWLALVAAAFQTPVTESVQATPAAASVAVPTGEDTPADAGQPTGLWAGLPAEAGPSVPE